MNMRILFSMLFCLFGLGVFAQLPANFRAEDQPPAPDYTQEKYWSALPFRTDAADVIPPDEQWISDTLKDVDVFYIYPTIYQKGNTWNADVNNEKLNRKIDKLPVRFQATVFNASCRVYAPRYRQGILKCYYDSVNGVKGLDFAYQDVARAFQYYLDHYNHGRPIIIASHSQGSNHSWRLLREFFDGKPLAKQLVCSYSVGMGVDQSSYKVLKPCEQPTETGCYLTWSSFKEGYDPGKNVLRGAPNVNPITWTRDSAFVPASASQGSIFLKVKHNKWQHAASAQIHHDYLWVKNTLPFVRTWNTLHLMDYNLYWYDIRKNVADRVKAYLKK
jgi:Protein of unknown function (DUF3089)